MDEIQQEKKEKKQALIGVDIETKRLIDTHYREKGFNKRSHYIKHLVLNDVVINPIKEIQNANPEYLE